MPLSLKPVVLCILLSIFSHPSFSFEVPTDNYSSCEALDVAGHYNGFFFENFNSTGSDTEGRLAAGGDLTILHYSVGQRLNISDASVSLLSGGNMTFLSGRVQNGSIEAGGNANIGAPVTNSFRSLQTLTANAPLSFDFDDVKSELVQISNGLSQLASNGTYESKWGGLYLKGDNTSDLQVFSLPGNLVKNAHTFDVKDIPSGATIIFNISGTDTGLTNMSMHSLSSHRQRVLYNFYEATGLTLRGIGVQGSILAPNAEINNPQGVIHGTLIGNSFNGPMQLNHRPFLGCFTVQNNNTAPSAQDISIDVDEDTSISVQLVGADADNDNLTYTVVSPPSSGSLTGTAPNLTYTPAINFSGLDNFSYTVNDGELDSSAASVTINVLPINDIPSADNLSFSGFEDIPLNIVLNGSDADNDALTFTILTNPTQGVLEQVAGNYVYQPAPNFSGVDSFTFQASDSQNTSLPATVSITIAPVNDAPSLANIALQTNEDNAIDTILSGSDSEGATLTYLITTAPANGSAMITGNLLTYMPNDDYAGSDTFAVSAFDGVASSIPAVVSVTVLPINDVPLILSSPVTTALEDTLYQYNVNASDVDSDNGLVYSLSISPSGMTIDSLSGLINWTPLQENVGVNTIGVIVTDTDGGASSQSFDITVTEVNDAPVILPIPAQNATATQLFTLMLSAQDEESDILAFSITSGPDGVAIDESTGAITWTPTASQTGTFTIDVNISDGLAITPFSLDVSVTPAPFAAPEFTGDTNIVGFVGEDFVFPLQIAAETDFTLELISGPDGLTLNSDTGEILKSDLEEGEFSFEVKATISEDIFTSQIFTVVVIDNEQGTEGSDFWLAFGYNLSTSVDGNLYLYVSSENDTTGVVDIPAQNLSIPFSVIAGEVVRIDIPPELRLASAVETAQNKGIHVTTQNKVVLYALNQKTDTTDGFLVYPTDTLGKRHRAMTYDGGQLYVVATQDNTTVNLTFSETVTPILSTCVGCDPLEYAKDETITILLQTGEVYAVEANPTSGNTLTGTLIESNLPIAAFSGHQCTFVPTGVRACDHLVEQLPDTKYWGSTYYSMPLASRVGGDIFRIVADVDNTDVFINGELIRSLDAGEWLEDTLDTGAIIEASHPILVAQLSKGSTTDFSDNGFLGDPAMIMLTPSEQFISRYQFTTTDQAIDFNYVNVIATTDGLTNMTLDGVSVDLNLFSQIEDTPFYGAQLLVNEGAHVIESNEVFGASIYGFGTFDSYGYQGGSRLPRYADASQFFLATPALDGVVGQEVCVDISLNNEDIPIINARVDVLVENGPRSLYHYFTNDAGTVTHCHVGITTTTENIVFTSGEVVTNAAITWAEAEPLVPYAPIFISMPVTSAKVDKAYQYSLDAIDANIDAALEYELMQGPAGMTLNGNVLSWSPLLTDIGKATVAIKVIDDTGLETTQTYNLTTVIGNLPPVVTPRSDIFKAYVGLIYQNFLEYSDPDGDVVYLEMLENSLYPARNDTNNPNENTILTARFTEDDIGIHPIVLRLYDRAGAETLFPIEIEVVLNNPPTLASAPAAYAKVGTPYSSFIEIDDIDGDNLRYGIISAQYVSQANPITSSPNGLSIDANTGLITMSPLSTNIGVYEVRVAVSDDAVSRIFTFRVSVFAEDEPFNATVLLQPQYAAPNDNIAFTTAVTGAGGSVVYQLFLGADEVPIDTDGSGSFIAPAESGIYTLTLTATDDSGQQVTTNAFYTVSDDTDIAAPVALIDSPASSELVSTLRDISITVQDDNLAQWQLYLVSNSNVASPALLAEGTGSLNNQIAATFDPTMLTNGLYKLQLQAIDINGSQTTDTIDVQLDGEAKVGNFTYTVNEFTVPLAGLPITINRTYDSRRKSEVGDFGYGWDLDYNLVKTEKSRALGSQWQLNEFSSGPLGALRDYCVQPRGDILVNVTLPNDEVERFKVKASPECNQAVPVLDVALTFEPQGDTQSTLKLASPQMVRLVDGRLENLGAGQAFDANDFVLTTREGYEYNFVANGDVRLITDPNSNSLTFSDSGITHSSGKAIVFSRDDDGTIRNIRRPDGELYNYSYSLQRDLRQVRMPDFFTRENYTYNSRHGLLTISDTDGNRKIRNIYNDEGRLIAQEDDEGQRTSFDYDLAGRESVVTDRNGNVSFYYYDVRGNVTSMVDALGQVSTYTYDANDNQLTETDPLGNTTIRTFNDNNDMLSITDPEGNTVLYTYNARGQEVTITDAKGNLYTNMYDSVGNLLSIQDPLLNIAGNNINAQGLVTLTQDMIGNITTMTYDSEGNTLTRTNPLGVITTYTYDADNRVDTQSMQRTTSDGELVTEVVTNEFDRLGRMEQSVDELGLVDSYSFDNLGNQTRTFNGLVSENYRYDTYNRLIERITGTGREYTTYDAEGNQLNSTDRNGNVTRYEYDALNRMVKTIHADDSFMSIEYDAAGRVISETDERGHTSTYEYDRAGRRTKIVDSLGHEYTYEYDENDNLVKETDALGRITSYVFDALDRRVSMTMADNTQMQDTFDGIGRNTEKTDQAAKITMYEYDPLGRLISVTDALNQVTTYEYDEAGNKTKQIDAEGRATIWEYDARGRITARILPLGQRETFTYDLADNVTAHTNFNNQTLNYTYNSNSGWLTRVTGPGIVEIYDYDNHGNRTVAENRNGRYNYTYDSRNRLATETQPNGTLLSYGYDDVGNKTSLVTNYVNGDIRTESFAYDELNRLVSVTDNQSQTTTFEYDAVGNQTHIRYPNGLVSISVFDSLNRITSITTLDADDNVLTSYVYGLDVTGRRASLTEQSGRLSTFTYDDVYRLTDEAIIDAVNGNHTSAYVYDQTGNRTQSTMNGITTAYVYDSNDRLQSQGAFSYTYDDQGNMLTESDGITTKTYGYDANQRMVAFTDGMQSVAYAYNPDGIRVSKNVDGTETMYLVDSNRDYAQVIAEQNASEVVEKEYVFGYDLVSQNDVSDTQYYHYDSLGTTRNLSDNTSVITDSYYYEAFGDLLASEGNTANDYLYSGEQFDAHLDNYYLRARYYNSSYGRFTQMDNWQGVGTNPITFNKYIYGNDDPLNFTDPTGNFSITELQVTNSIRTNLSNLQIDVGISLLDGYLEPDTASSNAGNNAIMTGLAVIGGPASFKLLRMLSGKFRKTCNSFTADTLVFTENGLIPIKDIKLGQKVWAYNEETGDKSLQLVIHLINGDGEKEIVNIELQTGEVIQATGSHPFYTNVNGEWQWLDANLLNAELDLFAFNKGQTIDIVSVASIWKHTSVYNLTVANDHTYFVGEARALAHNISSGSKCNFLPASNAAQLGVSRRLSNRQLRHVYGHPDYDGGGYFNSLDEAKNVFAAFHSGNVQILGKTKNGHILFRYSGAQGIHVSGSTVQSTNTFLMKGTTTTSVVPTTPNKPPAIIVETD